MAKKRQFNPNPLAPPVDFKLEDLNKKTSDDFISKLTKTSGPSKAGDSGVSAGGTQIIRDTDTGQITGIITPRGKVLSGLSPKEAQKFIDIFEKKGSPTLEASEVSERETQKLQNQEAQEIALEKIQKEREKLNLPVEIRQGEIRAGKEIPTILKNLQEERANLADLGLNKIQAEAVISLRSGEIVAKSIYTRQSLAQAYDFLVTAVSRKRPLTQASAEDTFNTMMIQLNNEIEAVKNGLSDGITAEINFRVAEEALNRYEDFQLNHYLGGQNLQDWIDNGANTDAQIIIMKENLIRLRGELEQAKIQSRLG